jgi:hypothetical protein
MKKPSRLRSASRLRENHPIHIISPFSCLMASGLKLSEAIVASALVVFPY